jgi:hypothetical protein
MTAGPAGRRRATTRRPPAAGPAAGGGPAADGTRVRGDRVYVGWQYGLLHPDPGPQPRRPVPPEAEQLNPGWLAAQRREQDRLSRPLKAACGAAAVLLALLLALWWLGALNAPLTGLGGIACLVLAARSGRAVRAGQRDLSARVEAERQRVEVIRAAQQRRLASWQETHARLFREWQSRREAFDRQLNWYAVSLPAGIDRLDVAGGTLSGWSAMLTMLAAPRLAAGGEVTVLDLTEGGVARDLLAVAGRSGIEPLVWVLPRDLPRLDLGTGLGREALADLLATTVSAGGQPGGPADPSNDNAILDRVLEVLGDGATIAQVTAALRALAQVGDPRADLASGLFSADQLARITALYGRGASDRVVIDRAWAIESRLRKLDRLAPAPVRLPPSRLRVAWLDRRAGAFGNQVLGIYMTAAMTHLLRQSPAAEPGQWWQHTLCVLGAERLPGEVLDGLCDASEASGTGLVIAYRSVPAPVKERLGRGNAAVAFMRLGNAEDAKTASEQIGTEHRFVLSQLTDTVGSSITDTGGDSYTSTVGTSDSVADSVSTSDTTARSRGRGRSHQDAVAPFGHFTGSASRDSSYSRSTSDSRSLTEGINESTAWGLSTSRAVGGNESLARTAQRSREFLVEQHELQQLPPSAMIVTYAAPTGRQVVLADANPGIMTLPTATLASLADARRAPETVVPVQGWAPAGARPAGAGGQSAAPAGRDGAGPAGAKSADSDGAGPAGADPAGGGDAGRAGAGAGGGEGSGPAADGPPPAGPHEGGRPPGSGARPGRLPWPPPARDPDAGPARDPDAAPARAPAPVSWSDPDRQPPPNLGPPPERLDWRTYRRR